MRSSIALLGGSKGSMALVFVRRAVHVDCDENAGLCSIALRWLAGIYRCWPDRLRPPAVDAAAPAAASILYPQTSAFPTFRRIGAESSRLPVYEEIPCNSSGRVDD